MLFRRREAHPEEEQLSGFLDGALDAGRTAYVAEHLRACERCAGILEGLGTTKAMVSELPQVQPSRSYLLGPEFVRNKAPAPVRSPLVFAPAVALTLFVALLAVDLRGVATEESTAGLEMADDAKAMASGQAQRSAEPPAAASGDAAQGMSPTGPVPAPSVAAGEVRPFSAPAEAAPQQRQSAGAANDSAVPAAPPPVAAVVPGAPSPGPAVAPGAPPPAAAVVPGAPSPGLAVVPGAPPPTTPAVVDEATSSDDPDWLRPLQALALGTFAVSLIAVVWPRLSRRGGSS